jgi:hypothetical protein
MVSFTLRQLYLEERAPIIHWIGSWVDPSSDPDDVE